MMRKKWVLISFCSLMVIGALVSALLRGSSVPERNGIAVPEPGFSPRQRPVKDVNPARDYSNAISDAVEKVMPSVVVVRTEKTQYRKEQVDLFGFYYRIIPEQLMGEGSGVILDEEGHVLTSWHVVENVEHIEVVLNDGKKLHAHLMGKDRATDLAVLKIDAEGVTYPAIEFGDSDAVRVGAVCIAIGSPFSLQSSVTVGHVSQKGRRVKILPYEDFIQTDAAINEGNSGGPLIDTDGRVIGINAAIKTDAAERGVGIAFAIPSKLAAVIAGSLKEKGVHEWPWVGAFFGETEGWDGTEGVPVSQVWRDTPAAEAGMLPGDVILKVDELRVRNEHDIYRIVFNHQVGETLRFSALRQGEEKLYFDLVLQEFPRQP